MLPHYLCADALKCGTLVEIEGTLGWGGHWITTDVDCAGTAAAPGGVCEAGVALEVAVGCRRRDGGCSSSGKFESPGRPPLNEGQN